MSKKKLVAFLANHDDDIYCFRKEVIEAVINDGYDVLISCPYGEKLELMNHIDYIYDDVSIDRRGTNVIADFKLFCHYIKLFKKHRPDVVLTYTAKPNVYGGAAANMLKIPYVCNLTGFGSVLNKGGALKAFILSLFKYSYNRAYCVMFQNAENMKYAVEEGLHGKSRRLIPGSGVALGRFPVQPYPEDGTVVFNYIGRILRDKGVDDYIAAAEVIRKRHPNTEFNMIGFIEPTEGHYEGELKELERRDIVHYRGSQKDVRPFIARSHVTVLPSVYGEGMSNVLLESAASGRPLITTDRQGCRETVEENVNGFIYQGGDVEGLIAAMEKLLALSNEQRKQMGLNGRKKMEKEFSRELVISAYLDTIHDILNQRSNI